MNILLLGGTGTLSTAVLCRALAKGYKLTVMNRGKRKTNLPNGVDSIICDFNDNGALASCFKNKRYDVVVDFLSRVPSDMDRVYPVFCDICEQYIFISSSCVYRRAEQDFPIRENSPKPNRDWNYNVEKYETEQRLIELSRNRNSYYTIIRPYITYDDERIPLGIAPAYKYHKTIIERIKAGKPWFVWDGGQAITTVTHTSDFAVGVVGLFLNPKAKNEDFHITGDYHYKQDEIVRMLFSKLNMPYNVISLTTEEISSKMPDFAQTLKGDRSLNALFDNSKIKSAVPELSFSVDFDNGLDRIIEYWNNCENYVFDYEFDARIDRMLASKGAKCSFKGYTQSNKKGVLTYCLFRYLPYRLARKINSYIG